MAVIAQVRPQAHTVAASCAETAERHPRLRIGLFVSNGRQPRALVKAFSEIARSEFAQIVLVGISRQEQPALPLAWRTYCLIDQWAFATKSDASDEVNLMSFLESTPVLSIPERSAGLAAVNRCCAEIVNHCLDVAFVLGDFECKAIESAAKYGVWRLGFGLREEEIAGLQGFREVAEEQAMTSSSLNIARPGEGEKVFYESRSRTVPFSLTRNRERLLRRIAQFPGRLLKELHQYGAVALSHPLHAALPDRQNLPVDDLKIMRSLISIGARIVLRSLQKLIYVEQWFMAYRFGNSPLERHSIGKFKCLMPPKDRFWADPFPLERDGRHFIFFEELVFAEGKAHIAVMEVDRQGRCSIPVRVLERPYHLSYPFLIETDGQLFMVPETGQNGTVELYRCLNFPDRWVLERVLLRAACCVDASFYHFEGRWWMFVNIGADGADAAIHDELHVYYADSLGDEWQAHCRNPVKSDVRSARSAGRLYEREEKLYRPSQIGTPLYGSGISINQVLTLTPQDYLEQEVERLVPSVFDNVFGVHTLNCAGTLKVVDGFVRRKRWGKEGIDFFEPARLGPDSASRDMEAALDSAHV